MGRTAVHRGMRACAALALSVGLLAACGGYQGSRAADPTTSPGATSSSTRPAIQSPGKLDQPTLAPDVLVFSTRTLPRAVVDRVRQLHGVTATEQFAMAQFYYQENQVRYAAVDPATFRRWTLASTAEATDVWKRVADGEIAIAPKLGKRIQDESDYVHIGDSHTSPKVHVGAYAQLFDPRFNDLGVDAVVNQAYVDKLGMVPDNAMLLTTGNGSPQRIIKKLRKTVGKTASVQILGFNFDPMAVQTAVLTGESVSSAVGTFNFTANPNGTVNPERSWVSSYIRTAQVPILGTVTCNKVMLPQLIDVMTEIRQRGLAKYIIPSQYGGCFVPRYIAGTHQLSYHAFGLAIDLNVPGNQRGTRGQMNPQIVQIFNHWGFQWGGTWHYTDPMHFQLDRIVRAG